MKQLISQFSDADDQLVEQLVISLSQIQWTDRRTMLKCLLRLAKLNKQVKLFGEPPSTLDQVIAESSSVDEALCAKLSFISILRQAKSAPADVKARYETFNQGIFSTKSLLIKLYGCKALIVRGDALGYKILLTLIEKACQDGQS